MEKAAKWTFMVYMAGDNNLSSFGNDDLDEIREAGSTDDVNLIVQLDNADNQGTRRYRALKGGNDELESLGITDSGDPNVLLDFIKWAGKNYPAERYALILWNHGSGWEPWAIDTIAQAIKAPNYSNREGVERAASPMRRFFFRSTLEAILSQPTPQDRAICTDDGSGHALDTIELGRVLERTNDILGQKLDLLGMDACLMSNLEVAYQAHPYVNYIVASEETEPGEGWPYKEILVSLVENPEQATENFASHIVSAYVQSYIEMGDSSDVTQTAMNLEKIGLVNTALDTLAGELQTQLPDGNPEMWRIQRKSKRFLFNLIDIGSLSANLEQSSFSQSTIDAAKYMNAALKVGTDQFVIAEAHNGAGVSAVSGVTLYMPIDNLSKFYKDLNFAEKNAWSKVLEKYLS